MAVLYLCCRSISLSIILGSKLNHCPRFEAVIQAGHAFAARLVSTDTCQANLTIGIGRANCDAPHRSHICILAPGLNPNDDSTVTTAASVFCVVLAPMSCRPRAANPHSLSGHPGNEA